MDKITKEDFFKFDGGLRIAKTFTVAREVRVVVECSRDVPYGTRNPTFTFVRSGEKTVRMIGRPKIRVSRHNFARCCAHAAAFFTFLDNEERNKIKGKGPNPFEAVQQGRRVKRSWIDGYYGNQDEKPQQELILPQVG